MTDKCTTVTLYLLLPFLPFLPLCLPYLPPLLPHSFIWPLVAVHGTYISAVVGHISSLAFKFYYVVLLQNCVQVSEPPFLRSTAGEGSRFMLTSPYLIWSYHRHHNFLFTLFLHFVLSTYALI
jgi:hypothetical protein